MNHRYLEIQKLERGYKYFGVSISSPTEVIRNDLFFVDIVIEGKSWVVLVDDEYEYFSMDNPLLNWFLVLNSLDIYDDCDDYLVWCKEYFVDAKSSRMISYYSSLSTTYLEIEEIIGRINPFISPYDYSLRTGVMKALLELENERL